MTYTDRELRSIYDRTSGYCHICHKKLAYKNHGLFKGRAAWEVDHSHPRASGGTDRLNNLYPSCMTCNRSKGATPTRTARARAGTRRAPMSRVRRRSAKVEAEVATSTLGAVVGGALAGPPGACLGLLAGMHFGSTANPDR